MLDLTLHRDEEQHDEVQQQDWPKHWHVENLKEGHAERRQDSPGTRMPKLEFGKPSRKGSGVSCTQRLRYYFKRKGKYENAKKSDMRPNYNLKCMHYASMFECIHTK